jgi:hypothetical protein
VKTFAVVDDGKRVELNESFSPTFLGTVELFAEQSDAALASHIYASK